MSRHGSTGRDSPRERIVNTAYELFTRHGIRAVGVDRIVAESGIAKATLYRHFRSKDELVLAFLDVRAQRWTRDWLRAEVLERASTPADRLLAVFDLFDEWFHRADFEACPFAHTLLETRAKDDPVRAASVNHLAEVGAFLEDLARQAGSKDPGRTASQWQMLMLGATVSAERGDLDSARRARDAAELILADALVPPR